MAMTQHGPLASHPQFSSRINGLLPLKNGGRLRLMRLFIPKKTFDRSSRKQTNVPD
jgi:hypothetical protein